MTSASLLSGLNAVASKVGGAFTERERAFGDIGKQLGEAVLEIAQITNLVDGLPGLLESETLNEATARVSKVARMISAIGSVIPDENKALTELLLVNKDVACRLDRLQNTIRIISILTLNAKIEAASVERDGSDFSNFTLEIAQLATTARATVDGYLRQHEKLLVLLNEACKAKALFQQKYQSSLLSLSGELSESLAAVESRRRQAAESALDIGARSKRINSAIGGAVMALQISDTTRQRIEHVHFAVEHMISGLSVQSTHLDDEVWAQAGDAAGRESAAAYICAMESAQMDAALAEYEEEAGKIYEALTRLEEECAGVAHHGQDLYGSSGKESGSFLEALKAKLNVAAGLIHECVKAQASVDRATAAVTSTVTELQGQIVSVSRIVLDMTLVGMNAALKSRQLGNSGKGLGIIADELRSYANQTAREADGLTPALELVIQSVSHFENIRLAREKENIPDLDNVLEIALKGFDNCAVSLDESLKGLSNAGNHILNVLRSCVLEIEGQRTAPAALSEARGELEALSHFETEVEFSPILLEGLMHIYWKRYTMASEREIHQQYCDAPATADAETTDPTNFLLDDFMVA